MKVYNIYYMPGEKMRDDAEAGIAIGCSILILGIVFTIQRKVDKNKKNNVVDLLNENNIDKGQTQ